MKYATFWRRFAAFFIDGLVLLPLILVFEWLKALSVPTAQFAVVAWAILAIGYRVYCHGKFGKTVGKHLLGIRVVQTYGEGITWRQAWLRSSVDIALAAFYCTAHLYTLSMVDRSAYIAATWRERGELLYSIQPELLRWSKRVTQTWLLADAVVLLLNSERRAIHDFIAGTVVIADFDGPPSSPQFGQQPQK